MTNKQMTGVLVRAKALIAEKSRWCQGTFARDELGLPVDPCHKDARRWCAIGAIYKVMGIKMVGKQHIVLDYLNTGCGTDTTAATNDSGYHGDVMLVYDQAIRKSPP